MSSPQPVRAHWTCHCLGAHFSRLTNLHKFHDGNLIIGILERDSLACLLLLRKDDRTVLALALLWTFKEHMHFILKAGAVAICAQSILAGNCVHACATSKLNAQIMACIMSVHCKNETAAPNRSVKYVYARICASIKASIKRGQAQKALSLPGMLI